MTPLLGLELRFFRAGLGCVFEGDIVGVGIFTRLCRSRTIALWR